MLRNYVKIAWRNLLENKVFSFLNVFGLALSMSAGLLILLLYEDGNNYDKFHEEAGLIYRLNTLETRKDGSVEPYATSPMPLRKLVESSFTWVDKVTSMVVIKESIFKDSHRYEFDGKITDANFLKIFNFSLQSGDPGTALNEPNSIVLTEKLSQKLFNDSDPVGQTLEVSNQGIYKVTGVLRPNPGKTHFEFEALLSSSQQNKALLAWENYQNTYTYIKVKPDTDIHASLKDVNMLAKPFCKTMPALSNAVSYDFDLQPLPSITPGYSIANAMGRGLPEHILWFLSLMGFLVMASAVFNYTNLTLAKSLNRAKEIGVRKIMGANRKQVLSQVIIEGIVISLVSLVLAFLLMVFLKGQLTSLQSFNFFDLDLSLTAFSVIYFVAFALLVGLIAGFLPALTISKLQPLMAVRNANQVKMFKRIGLTKSLLVLQLVFTMLFLMVVTTLQKQVEYAVKMDYGYTTSQIYNLSLQGIDPQVARDQLNEIAGVEKISAIDIALGTYDGQRANVRLSSEDSNLKVSSYSIDHEALSNLGLTLKNGENFKPDTKDNSQIIVNEKFVEKLNLGNPAEVIGQSVLLNDTTHAIIIGVVKDFLFKPADYALEPLILQNKPSQWNILQLKISPNRADQTVADIQNAWHELAKGYEFKGEYYDTTIEKNYTIYKDISKFINFFALMGALIGMMGLLGMTIYAVQKRIKEIGIRKVLGASEAHLVLNLSKGFLILVGIGFLIAIPIGLYMSQLVLDNFANRVPVGFNIVLPGLLFLSLISLLTVCSQTLKAALVNPVESIKNE